MPPDDRVFGHGVVSPWLWGLLPDNERFFERWRATDPSWSPPGTRRGAAPSRNAAIPAQTTDTASPADGTEPVPPPCRATLNPARKANPPLGGTGSALSAGNQPLPSHHTQPYPPQRRIRPRRRTGRSPSLHPAGGTTQPSPQNHPRPWRDRLRPVRQGPTKPRNPFPAAQFLQGRVGRLRLRARARLGIRAAGRRRDPPCVSPPSILHSQYRSRNVTPNHLWFKKSM